MTNAGRVIAGALIGVLAVVVLSIYFRLSGLLLLIGAILGLSVMWLNVRWLKSSEDKANAQLTQWAKENGWRLLEFNQEPGPGPFGGIHGRTEMYFQFVISDQEDNRRAGWARFDFGLFGGGRFEIKWNEKL